jgi:FkbM family methyltransferase
MRRAIKNVDSLFESVALPWGIEIKVRPNETIGHSIATMGVYDLSVTEVLWRLIDPCEVTIDIGANIGYMTSVMAKRVGQKGKVYSFEPHPEIYQELCENKSWWREAYGWNQIESQNLALSNISGTGSLDIPPHFKENRGVASLRDEMSMPSTGDTSICTVKMARLDDLMNSDLPKAVIKIDVEGHELKVLHGGVEVIRNVRDIIFEEHNEYPSEVTCFLEDLGFTVFRVHKEILGPRLKFPAGRAKGLLPWESPSYLATKDPSRARKRMEKRGWRAFAGNQAPDAFDQ